MVRHREGCEHSCKNVSSLILRAMLFSLKFSGILRVHCAAARDLKEVR